MRRMHAAIELGGRVLDLLFDAADVVLVVGSTASSTASRRSSSGAPTLMALSHVTEHGGLEGELSSTVLTWIRLFLRVRLQMCV